MRHYDIVKTTQDLRHLAWDDATMPTGVGGARPKARQGNGANATFFKLGRKTTRGFNCRSLVAELISCRVLAELGIPHLDQKLVKAQVFVNGSEQVTWVLRSKSARKAGQQAMPLSLFHDIQAQPGESPWQLCMRMGWEQPLGMLVVADYLTVCRRRGADKVMLLRSSDGSVSLAPFAGGSDCFGTGLGRSLWPMNPLANVDAQSVTGLSSLEYSLDLVCQSAWEAIANSASRLNRSVVAGLDVVDPLDSLPLEAWNIVKARWTQLAHLRHL